MYLVNNFYCFLCFSPCCVPVEILEHKVPDFPMQIIDLVALTYHYNPNCIILMLSYTISNTIELQSQGLVKSIILVVLSKSTKRAKRSTANKCFFDQILEHHVPGFGPPCVPANLTGFANFVIHRYRCIPSKAENIDFIQNCLNCLLYGNVDIQ